MAALLRQAVNDYLIRERPRSRFPKNRNTNGSRSTFGSCKPHSPDRDRIEIPERIEYDGSPYFDNYCAFRRFSHVRAPLRGLSA